jgi:CTP:molybdopterin cytidylyltransferase MocA
MSVAAVILAAGEGSRFGGTGEKLRAPIAGKPLLSLAVAPALGAGLDDLVIVAGAADIADMAPPEATVLNNEQWRFGQATSLRVALDWCHRRGHSGAVVGLGDMPGLTSDCWRRVASAEGGPIVVATYRGRRGHPVRLDAAVWPSLPMDGDEGARSLMARHPELVVEVACEGRPADIDTREDLRRWS